MALYKTSSELKFPASSSSLSSSSSGVKSNVRLDQLESTSCPFPRFDRFPSNFSTTDFCFDDLMTSPQLMEDTDGNLTVRFTPPAHREQQPPFQVKRPTNEEAVAFTEGFERVLKQVQSQQQHQSISSASLLLPSILPSSSTVNSTSLAREPLKFTSSEASMPLGHVRRDTSSLQSINLGHGNLGQTYLSQGFLRDNNPNESRISFAETSNKCSFGHLSVLASTSTCLSSALPNTIATCVKTGNGFRSQLPPVNSSYVQQHFDDVETTCYQRRNPAGAALGTFRGNPIPMNVSNETGQEFQTMDAGALRDLHNESSTTTSRLTPVPSHLQATFPTALSPMWTHLGLTSHQSAPSPNSRMSSDGVASPMSSVSSSRGDYDDDDQAKLERKRAKNREAAQRCQLRKQERVNRLEGRVEKLKEQNSALTQTVVALREQITGLQRQIIAHSNTGCCVSLPGSLMAGR